MRGSASFLPSLINIMLIIFVFRSVQKAIQKKKKQAGQENEQPFSEKPVDKPTTIISSPYQAKDLKHERPAAPHQPMNLKRCPNCGGEIPATMLKCEICGHRQPGCMVGLVVLLIFVISFAIYLLTMMEGSGTTVSELLSTFWNWFTRM
ncbi:MAG: hypothetical protein R6V77_06615 [Candidatus Cloacimonadaceae bacterium]